MKYTTRNALLLIGLAVLLAGPLVRAVAHTRPCRSAPSETTTWWGARSGAHHSHRAMPIDVPTRL
ncbi:MAG: hypothetical protein WCP04_03240 [Pseudomonadota bacterium]|jgi:hypothetical protein